MQLAVTHQLEHAAVAALQRRVCQTYQPRDPQRAALMTCDRFVTVLLSSWAMQEVAFTNLEWQDAMCTALGLGIPSILRPGHVGRQLPPVNGVPQTLDASGHRLLLNKSLCNRGDIRVAWHDSILDTISRTMKSALNGDVSTEVFGLFASLLPANPRARDAVANLMQRRRNHLAQRHIVPDLMFPDPRQGGRRRLSELKTMGLTVAHHNNPALSPSPRGGNPTVLPVDRRAKSLTAEYIAHAKDLDRAVATALGRAPPPPNSANTPPGPAEQRLRSYGDIVGLVFAWNGAGSAGAHDLAKLCGSQIAAATWRDEGGQTLEFSIAAQVNHIYRLWGLTAARAAARCRLTSLAHVVGGQITTGAVSIRGPQRIQAGRTSSYLSVRGPAVHPPSPLLF
mmetsp:Transcript_27878/g.85544  ORF Transcript_27878/g.85544 Transcript_27878/m.85544 type:complete len:395 (+) Transcript_27878:262-1446(+)